MNLFIDLGKAPMSLSSEALLVLGTGPGLAGLAWLNPGWNYPCPTYAPRKCHLLNPGWNYPHLECRLQPKAWVGPGPGPSGPPTERPWAHMGPGPRGPRRQSQNCNRRPRRPDAQKYMYEFTPKAPDHTKALLRILAAGEFPTT